jgi:hypothetical protein
MATLTVHIESAQSVAGVVETLQQALADARAVSAWTLHGTLRTAGVLAPLGLIFGLPVLLVLRLRRSARVTTRHTALR